tara:strand:+ start:906 stop:1139 length:234 start_codon:yes stop_codon:yes gene_type:complete
MKKRMPIDDYAWSEVKRITIVLECDSDPGCFYSTKPVGSSLFQHTTGYPIVICPSCGSEWPAEELMENVREGGARSD